MDDFVINVRQIGNYPLATVTGGNDLLLLQQNGLGGPYAAIKPSDLVSSALDHVAGNLQLQAGSGIEWNDGSALLYSDGLTIATTVPLHLRSLAVSDTATIGGDSIAGQVWVGNAIATTTASLTSLIYGTVTSFNNRRGDVVLSGWDINWALGLQPGDSVASRNFVNASLSNFYANSALVHTWNGRGGTVVMTADDITLACTAPGAMPKSNSPALGDASDRIATTSFVDESMDALHDTIQQEIAGSIDLTPYALLNSPSFTGIPTAPTANPGSTTGQIATTAFVMNAVAASTSGVASFNTRTGAVVLTLADVTGVGAAPIASPNFTGIPAAPTAAVAVSTTQLATTAFVHAVVSAVAAGVTTWNGRSGAVTLTTADVTGAGGAPANNPALTGAVTAPTAAQASSDTTVATTAFVHAAITAIGTAVTAFNGRTGSVTLQANDVSAVGGALIASPTFTGTPSGPTATLGTNTLQLATTAFVQAQIAATAAGVVSFNGRTGAVTLVTADVTGAGGAPIASPALSGTPTAPTLAQADSSTALATTAFVHAAVSAQSGVASFNGRTGAVTLSGADVSAAGAAMVASPTFTGTPSGPTAAPGNATTQLATTAFVAAAIASQVSSFNGRNGAVTLTSADLTAAGGALLASPSFTGTPTAPTPTVGTSNTQLATTAFVNNAIGAISGAVRYDAVQTLTATQQAQARANTGALKKNYVLNGAMLISQENGATAATVNGYFPVDQFQMVFSNAGTQTAQQVASPTPGGSSSRLRITATVADAAVGATDLLYLNQKIEGLRAVDLGFGAAGAKTTILQFGVKAPAGTYCIAVVNNAQNRSYVAEYVIAAGEANTAVVKSVVIPGDITGTWQADTSTGLELRWGLMAGTSVQQAAGAWGTASVVGSANQLNFMATVNNVFELFDVGLYEGAAPAFQVGDYARELTLCQRYYQFYEAVMVQGNNGAASSVWNCFLLSPPMRIPPSLVVTGTLSYSNASGFALNGSTSSSATLRITITAVGYGYGIAPFARFSSRL